MTDISDPQLKFIIKIYYCQKISERIFFFKKEQQFVHLFRITHQVYIGKKIGHSTEYHITGDPDYRGVPKFTIYVFLIRKKVLTLK